MKTTKSSSEGALFSCPDGPDGPEGVDGADRPDGPNGSVSPVGPVPTDGFKLYMRGIEPLHYKQEETLGLGVLESSPGVKMTDDPDPEPQTSLKRENQEEADMDATTTALVDYLGPNAATGLTPSMQPWNGDRHFGFRIEPPKMAKDPQFSQMLNKVFLNMNQSVNILFSYVSCDNLFLRAVLVFTEDDHLRFPVDVCPKHLDRHSEIQGHLLRSSSALESFYGEDSVSGRHYVMVKLPNCQTSSEEVSVGFLFADLSSCCGGINRRDAAVIFTLELYGEVIGRLLMPLRICTNPKRGLKVDENQFCRVQPIITQEPAVIPHSKRKYWVLANGEDNYKALCSIGEVLERKDSGDIKQWKSEVTSFNLIEN